MKSRINKKYSRKNKKYSRKNKKYSRKNKKGGAFFFGNKSVVPSLECDPNNLTSIHGSQALHANYQKCCPKGTFGTKNSSPYCKQVDLNFQAALKGENYANEYHGYEPDEVYQMKQTQSQNEPYVKLSNQQYDVASAQKKPWYKFWGGKTRKNKKHSRRHRK
jgi:hypothetical protein